MGDAFSVPFILSWSAEIKKTVTPVPWNMALRRHNIIRQKNIFHFRIWCKYFVILSVVTVSETKNDMYCYLLVEISTSQLSQNINSCIKSSSTSIDPVYIFFYFDYCYYFILIPKLHFQIFIFGNFPSSITQLSHNIDCYYSNNIHEKIT